MLRYLTLTLALGLLIFSGCQDVSNPSQVSSVLPIQGTNPLPSIQGHSYKSSTPISKDNQLLRARSPEINWSRIKLLLKKAQQQTGQRFAAIYSVIDSTKKSYNYSTATLQFSKKALKDANGQLRPYLFEGKISNKPNTPVQLLAAYIPDSKQAEQEMQQWIFSKTTTKSTKPNSWKEQKKENRTDRLLDTCYHSAVFNDTDGSYTVIIQEYECVVATNDGGSGGGLDEGPGGGSSTCDQQLLPTEDCPGSGSNNCPLYCGGGGGVGGGNEGNPPTKAPDGVPQDIYNRLNSKEKTLCYADKTRCIGVYHAKEFAEKWAAQNELTGAHNGPQDALRHAMWNAKMAYAYGKDYAKKWGDAHEFDSTDPDETVMDLHNNAVGRAIGGPAGRDLKNFSIVKQGILNAQDNGDLCLYVNQCK